MGKYFYQFGVAISVAVAISLLEAITLTPMRCSQFLEIGERKSGFGKRVDGAFDWLHNKYENSLPRFLKRRAVILIVSLVCFVLSLGIISLLKKEFVPPQDQSIFFCRMRTPTGSSIEFTNEKFKEAEKFIMSRPEVERYFAAIGGFGGGEVNRGQIFVTLKEPKDRPVVEPFEKRPSQKELMDYFRKELNKIADLRTTVQDPSLEGFSARRGFPIEFTIIGPDWRTLADLSEVLKNKMAESTQMVDVDSDYDEGVTEIQIFPDREAAFARGVSVDEIAQTINTLIAGQRVAKYTQNGRRYDVRVRLSPSQRTQAEDIEQLWVWNNRGELVQLKDVIRIEEHKTSLSITRRNRERAINLTANIAPGSSQTAAMEEVNKLTKEILPENYRAVFGGSAQSFQESFNSLYFVLWLGIIIAYMILASQFNSYKDPITVLLALPFSITGALIALWITQQSLNVYSFIGIILLMGIVKKNSIMLVDFTNQVRAQGKNVKEALIEAAPTRLRPILMTSAATIAAAIPPAIALGPGAEVMRPMATAVIGGIVVSTILTLIVVPCFYSLVSKDKK